MTHAHSAISVCGLAKSFGTRHVLTDLAFEVPAGDIYALLGPNGAGKTTTVEILSTLATPDAGRALVAGFDVSTQAREVRASIGVTGQYSAVDEILTGVENLTLIGDLQHLGKRGARQRAAELLERFDLVGAAGQRAGTYSGGTRRRLDLAMSLVGNPAVIFLDEPTTGLDPRSRRDMWDVVRELADSGVTILLTTQYLDEADELADRIGVLDGGRLVAEGTPAELKALVPGGHIELRFATPSELDSAARSFTGARRDDDALTLEVPSDCSVGALGHVLDRLDHLSTPLVSLHTPDLDDVFFALTEKAAS